MLTVFFSALYLTVENECQCGRDLALFLDVIWQLMANFPEDLPQLLECLEVLHRLFLSKQLFGFWSQALQLLYCYDELKPLVECLLDRTRMDFYVNHILADIIEGDAFLERCFGHYIVPGTEP